MLLRPERWLLEGEQRSEVVTQPEEIEDMLPQEAMLTLGSRLGKTRALAEPWVVTMLGFYFVALASSAKVDLGKEGESALFLGREWWLARSSKENVTVRK